MRARATLAALTAAAGLVAVPAVSASTRLPGLLWHDGGRRSAFWVRPHSVYDTEDGSGIIGVLHRGGAEIERGSGRGSLTWRHWTAKSAYGVGTIWIKFGTPTATSPFTREALTIYVYRVRDDHFTRMQTGYRQGGHTVHVTECLTAPFDGSYTWGELYRGQCT